MSETSETRQTPPVPLTKGDWVLAGVAAAAIAALMLFPLGTFRDLFDDFGARNELPLLTRMALYPGFSVLVALPSVAMLFVGLRSRRPLKERRVLFACAFGACLLGFALCFLAMYLPIFSIAGKIKAD